MSGMDEKPVGPDKDRMNIVYRRIADLEIDAKNPRIHNAKQIRQIAHSIKAFGFNVPVLVDRCGKVVAGHGRILACKHLGLNEVPTISLEHLKEPQVRAFMIADNRLTETSIWDDRLLAEQLKELSILDLNFSLEATGFDMGEIDLRIEGLSTSSEASDKADLQVTLHDGPAVSHDGDLWLLGEHRVRCGSALDPDAYTVLMQEEKAEAVFSDPPYNVAIEGNVSGLGVVKHREFAMASGEMSEAEFSEFLTRAFSLHSRHTVEGSLHYICMDWRHTGELLAAGRIIYSELKNVCVWVKSNAGMGSLYRSQHEMVFVYKYGEQAHRNNVRLGQFGRNRTNVWHYPGINSFSRSGREGNLLALHPTVKPVSLVADAIMDSTSRRSIVLDGFLGSGTSVIAAERSGRRCYGLEIDPQYVDTIVRRWQKYSGQTARNSASGKSFQEIEAGMEVEDGKY